MTTLGVVAVEVLSQFGTVHAVTALLLAIAVLIGAIGRLTRDVLNYRLARRALKKKKAHKALGDVAKVIEAQQGKRRRWRSRKNEPPNGLPPMLTSGSSSS
jgi:hypothetical protein